jgi:hypothetical protein
VKETPTGSSEILAQVAEYCAVAFGLAVAVMLLWPPRSATQSPTRSARPRRPHAFTSHPHVRR